MLSSKIAFTCVKKIASELRYSQWQGGVSLQANRANIIGLYDL